jgi:hypothetical protein
MQTDADGNSENCAELSGSRIWGIGGFLTDKGLSELLLEIE